MISYRLIVLILNLVGHLAGIYQLLNTGLDNLSALGNLLDDIDVAGSQLLAFLVTEDVNHVLHILGQLTLIVSSHRDDVVHAQVAHYTSLNLNLLGVGLPFHLVTGFQLVLLHDTHILEHLDRRRVEITLENLWTALLAVQTTLGSFLYPLI